MIIISVVYIYKRENNNINYIFSLKYLTVYVIVSVEQICVLINNLHYVYL